MMGLEPTTFCMARKPRDPPGGDTRRHSAQPSRSPEPVIVTKRHQLTRKADSKAD